LIGLYLVASALLGYLISLVRDVYARRQGKGAKKPHGGAEAAG
jgi:hypothetical protein